MKYLLVTIGCFFCLAMSAQTGFVEFPYNPDSDGDDLIGTADLLDLLALYGLEFSEEDLYLSEDSTSALLYTGQHNFYRCYKSCKDLPGNWRLPHYYDMLGQELSSFDFCDGCYTWIDLTIEGKADPTGGYHRTMLVAGGNSNDGGISSSTNPDADQHCLCYTHERPKVEYSYCEGTNIQECADSKMLDGWYPLGGPAYRTNNSPNKLQAFWRWAE
jgi:hypothetical protein